MAYITNYNATAKIVKRVLNKVDLKDYINELFIDNMEKLYQETEFFSEKENKELLIFKSLFEDPKAFAETFVIEKEPVEATLFDDDGYVQTKSRPPAYHIYKDCKKLHADLIMYKIPPPIKVKGDNAVKLFMKHWDTHLEEREKSMDRYLLRVSKDFKVDIRQLDLKRIPNSGATRVKNQFEDIKEIEGKINEKLLNFHNRINAQNQTASISKEILFDEGYATKSYTRNIEINTTKYSLRFVQKVVDYFYEEFKKPITSDLKRYYQIKYHRAEGFNNKFLDDLGFVPCRECLKKKSKA